MNYVPQKFDLKFKVTKECDDIVDIEDVQNWFEEYMDGCDVGDFQVHTVLRLDGENYAISAQLSTECDERKEPADVINWLENYMYGSDFGKIKIESCVETK
jgi:hypothetical protein